MTGGSVGVVHEIRAELVATVLDVCVHADQVVEAGHTLVLLESMKMEIPVLAEHAGRVRAVGVVAGDSIRRGHLLASIVS